LFRFEKLDVWQKAIVFADSVCAVTATFPSDERFGLTNQMRRASVSVSSNIAEGSGRSTNPDFARFVEIAYASVMEVVSQCYIAHRQKMLGDDQVDTIKQQADELARMLSGLRNSLRAPK
jgi:four helix bundle protein